MSGAEVALYALGVVIFLVALMVSISLHELGHLHYAKKFGCRVSQFMVGFGPTVWSIKRGETEYGLKLIPLGGYVKIIGMFPPETQEQADIAAGRMVEQSSDERDAVLAEAGAAATPEAPVTLRRSNTGLFTQLISQTRSSEFEQVEPADSDRLFYKLPTGKKIMVMLAGPAVNIALAFVCFLGVYGIHGTHALEPTGSTIVATVGECVIPVEEAQQRNQCQPGDAATPARAAGLQVGDEIVAFNGQQISTWDELASRIHANGDGSMQLEVLRDGDRVILQEVRTVELERDLEGTGELTEVGYLGASPESEEVVTRHGPIFTMIRMGEMTSNAVETLVDLPARVWNVMGAVAGLNERSQDSPMSVIGGSRLAGEVASSDVDGLDIPGKAALLAMVIGSFNLFIGIFNLVPLMPLDGGHIVGAAWEGLRRKLAKVFKRPDPGYVNVAAQLPLAYCLGLALLAMSFVLMVGDILVPISSGL